MSQPIFLYLEPGFPNLFNIGQSDAVILSLGLLPQAILAMAFRGDLVEEEVKGYVREAGEMMIAEGQKSYKKK